MSIKLAALGLALLFAGTGAASAQTSLTASLPGMLGGTGITPHGTGILGRRYRPPGERRPLPGPLRLDGAAGPCNDRRALPSGGLASDTVRVRQTAGALSVPLPRAP